MTADALVFLASLVLSVVSSLVLAEGLDRLGERLELSEGLLGILTALGADAPEISAAVAALQKGQGDLGVGVVLGSNLFNLAALLGLSAVVAGGIRLRRRALALNGAVALLATVVVSALVLGWLGPWPTVGLLALVLVPYLAVSSVRPDRAGRPRRHRSRPLRGGAALRRMADSTLVEVEDEQARRGRTAPRASRQDALTVVPALVSVVVASVGMVDTATSLGRRWDVPPVLIGTLVLGSLTGIPNAIAAVRLARRHRGQAVVSEALNSNTINLVFGIAVPALIVGTSIASGPTVASVWWLLAMTAAAVVLAGRGGGMSRWEGLGVIGVYLVFVAMLVAR